MRQKKLQRSVKCFNGTMHNGITTTVQSLLGTVNKIRVCERRHIPQAFPWRRCLENDRDIEELVRRCELR